MFYVGSLPVKQENMKYSGSAGSTSHPINANFFCAGTEENLGQCIINITSSQMLEKCSGKVISAAICQC